MGRRSKKIVLYQPRQADERLGRPSSKDLLPLELLSIAAFPLRDGYEVVLIDGSLYDGVEGHDLVLEACDGAMLYATTGLLGYMVIDGWEVTKKVKARYPTLPAVIGGWFASVLPELHLATGLYEAVAHGQGELTFRDVVAAIDAGEPLDDVAGLSLLRDGQVVPTPARPVVGWEQLPNLPWSLLDIEPYRRSQLRPASAEDVHRMPTPRRIGRGRPYFGVAYSSSFGCPEPCTFCCSPLVTSRRWKAMPADRLLDDLTELEERWGGFDVLRFHDANFGVSEKRVRRFAEGLLDRGLRFHWTATLETRAILQYEPETLDLLAESGMYIAQMGAEAGTDEMMTAIGKRIRGDDNVTAAIEMDRRGIQAGAFYIIGYPGESSESMLATIDQCRRMHNACPGAHPMLHQFRPIPGTVMWDQALELGYVPPSTFEGWGLIGEFHVANAWAANIAPHVDRARRMFQYHYSLSAGLTTGREGWREKRARRRMVDGSYLSHGARFEARAFGALDRVKRGLLSR